jgi:D-sedoheptulose 7-phosphate isomerase
MADSLQQGVPAIALSGHPALSTAIQNDVDPAMVFAQQVYVYGTPHSVVIGISTSGNSKNVLLALKVARAMGMKTIGLTGSRPGRMDEYCDILIKVPAMETYAVQEFHLPIYHAICMAVENTLFGS